jgi:dienelactone hydrolase
MLFAMRVAVPLGWVGREGLGCRSLEIWRRRLGRLGAWLARGGRGWTVVALAAFLGAAEMSAAQTIEVSPASVLADEPATIRVAGLDPQQHAVIRAELTDGAAQAWVSEAEFAADQTGVIDTSKQAPVKGSYRIVSAMGLVWSMKPTAKDVHSYSVPRGPEIVHFELMKNGSQAAAADLEQSFYPTNLRQINLDGLLHGVLVLPDAPGPHPGVLVLGGSEGGTPRGRAVWLAAHGYAALALAYFRVPGLPQQLENIPLEYFGQAIGWMKQRPEIAAGELAVMGGSRGGELALQLGALYTDLHAVVAFVPANVRFPSCCNHDQVAAWTWKGEPLAYELPFSKTDNPADLAAIHIELTHGPILMISGDDDGIWSSREMADAAMRRLETAHFRYRFEHLSYPHAGHRAGEQWIMPAWSSGVRQPVSGEPQNLGGTPEGNAASTLDAGPKVLEFLRQSLADEPSTAH